MGTFNKIMALDVGDARIGVALSDAMGFTAQPHSTVNREPSDKRAYAELSQIVKAEDVKQLVVGLPLELDGTEGEQAKKVRKFVSAWQASDSELGALRVEYLDERFTTAQAERVVVESGLKNKDKSAALDRVSAAIILQTYLEQSQV